MTDDTVLSATNTPDPEPHWLPRGRRILTIGTWVTAVLSVVLTAALMVLGESVMGPAFDESDGGVAGALGGFLMIAPPVLFAVALNLLVWRTTLRALARRDRAKRPALVIGVAAALAIGSIFLVMSLLLVGLFAMTLTGN
jgi:uncharacterized membrane protein YkvI